MTSDPPQWQQCRWRNLDPQGEGDQARPAGCRGEAPADVLPRRSAGRPRIARVTEVAIRPGARCRGIRVGGELERERETLAVELVGAGAVAVDQPVEVEG